MIRTPEPHAFGFPGAVYQEIQQFYAHQMQLLDGGAAEEWAETFTADGVFAQNVKPEPWRGRSEIAARLRTGLSRLAGRGMTRRHWFGMVDVTVVDHDAVETRYYTTVFETPAGGPPSICLSALCEDVLVYEDGRWLVRYRLVSHDGA